MTHVNAYKYESERINLLFSWININPSYHLEEIWFQQL